MSSKICTQCNEDKSLDNYYRDRTVITKIAYRSKCKTCCGANSKARKSNPKDTEINEKKCSVCNVLKPIDSYFKSTRHKDGYFSFCKTCHDAKVQNKGNNQKIKRTVEYMKEYNKKQYSNQHFKTKHVIRANLNMQINKSNNKNTVFGIKNNRTFDYVGCDINFFKLWIEQHFDEHMNWSNHGEYWHYDHIKPCASFDLTDEKQIYECYHWSNLRPLFKSDNLSKSDNIENDTIEDFKLRKEIFLENYSNDYKIVDNKYIMNILDV
jgi:hypothetical protein